MRKLSAFLMLFILIGFLAAVPMVASAKEHPIKEKVFITYETGLGASTDQYDVFSYDGLHWYDGPRTSGIPATGIKYYVNTASAAVKEAVKASFETWDAQVTVELFDDNVETISKAAGNRYDGKNVVSWGALRRGIVAVCYVWYYSDTLEIVEFGIVFNKLYAWGIDPDGEGTTYTISAFDVQNVATHEAGHTLSLSDLYMDEASALTMYGYTSIGETKKQSLGLGDIHGVQYIYGA